MFLLIIRVPRRRFAKTGPDQEKAIKKILSACPVAPADGTGVLRALAVQDAIRSEGNNVPHYSSYWSLKNIQKAESFTEENLTVKRPGTGISPMRWDEVIGQVAQKDYEEDELI